MTQTIRHQIKRVIFDFQYSDEPTAFEARKKLETLFHSDFIPVLETVFDQHAPHGRPYYIPRLEIDLGSMDPQQVAKTDLAGILYQQLVQQLKDVSFTDIPFTATPISGVDTLFQFLTTGTWPCPTIFENVDELEQEVRALPSLEFAKVMAELPLILSREGSSLRFVYQFNVAFVDWIIDQLIQKAKKVFTFEPMVLSRLKEKSIRISSLKNKASFIHDLALTLSQKITPEVEKEINNMFDVFIHERESQVEVSLVDNQLFALKPPGEEKRIGTIAGSDIASKFKEEATSGSDISLESEDEAKTGMYTSFAGVVLLHPFLGRFFQGLNLLNAQNQFESIEAQRQAIHVLHFLASGVENPEEPATGLLKVLCGYPLTAPLEKVRTVSSVEKEEAQALLLAVVGHWSTLKNTSSDGFRREFLQRDGKLEVLDSGIHLTVEQRSIDVLLSSLPWSCSIIRLPWMERPLRVDWA